MVTPTPQLPTSGLGSRLIEELPILFVRVDTERLTQEECIWFPAQILRPFFFFLFFF